MVFFPCHFCKSRDQRIPAQVLTLQEHMERASTMPAPAIELQHKFWEFTKFYCGCWLPGTFCQGRCYPINSRWEDICKVLSLNCLLSTGNHQQELVRFQLTSIEDRGPNQSLKGVWAKRCKEISLGQTLPTQKPVPSPKMKEPRLLIWLFLISQLNIIPAISPELSWISFALQDHCDLTLAKKS